ncbi:hypothetical protein PcaKH15_30140 [Parageobacillus caldoxylosilyticus]|uniref:Uncharacterized protein n=1 Tax=Parageobacillus caldoxylosilyticus NBRC 107762 TaxID=1220594 RepID=A0A023DCG4_9BACL|nr:hypothetical protein PcaKH15_30140 [Parageobacillus caldoxylosilyticus]BDG40899.1 hypothetical protein PcaKH16_30380 [Parageobacillus caldoxylosilyticus]BDG44649.1 hypothetical protein PcaKH35_29940 [Parageobacillus caldoxylosilyticus]GAJ38998.1 hypothetical protein GCA01S_011_00510 [Parageobacillus caldoxylosilyticus NBRC 107762]
MNEFFLCLFTYLGEVAKMNEISDIIGILKDEEMKLLRIQVLAIYPFDWLAVIIIM